MSSTTDQFAVDLDLLEKEIELREKARKETVELSGDINGTTKKAKNSNFEDISIDPSVEFNTLEEPILNTINRDLKIVKEKFYSVLVPSKRQNISRDWDLWGPMFICVALSLLLQGNNKGPQFTQVFTLAFFGSFIVTMNIKLLGGKISFFQTLCLIGYCLLPSVFSSMTIKIASRMIQPITVEMFIRAILSLVSFVWAIYASMVFLTGTQAENRKILGYYPLFLFYFVVSWLVITNA